jgi:hypothetical protein
LGNDSTFRVALQMSRQTTAYDAIVAALLLLYPEADGWTRIPYAYDLPSNDDNFLRKGWGVKIGSATRVDLEFCNLAFRRTVTVALSLERFNTGSDTALEDDIAKELLENIYKAQSRFYQPDQLLVEASIVKIDPTDSTGVEAIDGQSATFLTMETSFDFLIQEPI